MANAQRKEAPILLNQLSLENLPPDVLRPEYDRSEIAEGILHFGVGAFHRAHQARYLDELFANGYKEGWGIHGCGIRSDSTALRRSLAKQNCLYSLKRQLLASAVVEFAAGLENVGRMSPDSPSTSSLSL